MTSSVANWSSLPESIWLNIFSRLQSIDLLVIRDVCLQWRRISSDYTLTSSLDLRSNRIEIKSLIDLLSFVENNLKSLKMRNNRVLYRGHSRGKLFEPLDTNKQQFKPIITEEVMSLLRDRCKRLSRLSLEDLTEDQICYQNLPKNLSHLSLCGYTHHRIDIFDSFTDDFDHKFESIVYLNLSRVQVFESSNCRSLNHFQCLKYLYLEGLHRVNSWGVIEMSPKLLSQLVVIDLEGTEVNDKGFEYIVNNDMSLEVLYLAKTQTKADFDFSKSVAKNLKQLCLLKTAVNENGLKAILRSHPSLTSVNCGVNIRKNMGFNTPVLKTEVNAIYNTCRHYLTDNRFDKT